MRDYSLTWRQPELLAIELYRDTIRFEKRKIFVRPRDSLTIRPYSQMCVTNVIIAAQPLVGTPGRVFRPFDRWEGRLVDLRSWNAAARREAGFAESGRPLGVGNDPITRTDRDPGEVRRFLHQIEKRDAVVHHTAKIAEPF
jgi:hypothetical protein